MNRRRAIAVLSLIGILVSAYLLLAKIGQIGSLSCTVSRGCDLVNTSPYSVFMGVPVAAIGLTGYAVLLVLALVALRPSQIDACWPDRAMAILSGGGLLFSLRLTYYELFEIHAICQWCVVSQAAILLIFGLAVAGLVRAPRGFVGEVVQEE